MVNKGMRECEKNPFGKTSGRDWNADTKEYRSGVRKAAPEIIAGSVPAGGVSAACTDWHAYCPGRTGGIGDPIR